MEAGAIDLARAWLLYVLWMHFWGDKVTFTALCVGHLAAGLLTRPRRLLNRALRAAMLARVCGAWALPAVGLEAALGAEPEWLLNALCLGALVHWDAPDTRHHYVRHWRDEPLARVAGHVLLAALAAARLYRARHAFPKWYRSAMQWRARWRGEAKAEEPPIAARTVAVPVQS